MNRITQRVLTAAIAGVTATGLGVAAVSAATTDPVATCTSSPAVTYSGGNGTFTQTCSVPVPTETTTATVTATETVPGPTVTVTKTVTPSPTTSTTSPTTDPTTPPPTTTAPEPAVLKPRVSGLVVTDPADLSKYNGVVKNALLKSVTWADVESTQGNYDFSKIRSVLNGLPAGAHLKIVVDSGTHAPQWVKDWGSVNVVLNRAGTSGQVPYFWTDRYVAAYNALQDHLAAEFNDDPRLLQVVYSGTMTENSEPFTLGGDDASATRLYNAGFRWATEKSSMDTMLTHMLETWDQTHVEFALHGAWQYATASGIGRGSWSDIEAFVDPFAAEYGDQFITADYGLGPSDGPPDQPYAYMQTRGPNSSFQLTVGSPYNDDTRATSVVNGIDMGASAVEHAAFSGGKDLDTGKTWTLEELEAALEANAAG